MVRSADQQGSRTILLVEDNPGDARLVEEVCRELGLSELLHTVSSGSAALDFVTQRGEYASVSRPDLVVLDWHLPNRGGPDVLAELNGEATDVPVPVIVTSGPLSAQDVRDIYDSGANALIEKPAGPDELKTIIRSFEAFWLSTATLPTEG